MSGGKIMSNKPPSKFRGLIKPIAMLTVGVGLCVASAAFADGQATGGVSLTDVTTNVNHAVSAIANILTDIALVVGIGFVLAAFFKFHQHKQNPQQVPMSQGITLLLIGAGLLVFPILLPTMSKTVFGSSTGGVSQVGGNDMQNVIGGSTTGG
jgi:intracellular multiplication protein IcmD